MWDYYFNEGTTLMHAKAHLNNKRFKVIVIVSIKNCRNSYTFKKSKYVIF